MVTLTLKERGQNPEGKGSGPGNLACKQVQPSNSGIQKTVSAAAFREFAFKSFPLVALFCHYNSPVSFPSGLAVTVFASFLIRNFLFSFPLEAWSVSCS